MKYPDMHCHSRCSFDGEDSVIDLYRAAEEKGLLALAVTDHCECNAYIKDGFKKDIDRSCKEVADAQKKVKGEVILLSGVEIGQPMQNPQAVDDVLTRHSFDVVLWSLHNMKDMPDFYDLHYSSVEESEALLERYFDELYEMAQWNCYDVLSHLTYPLRYMVGREHIPVRREKFTDQIDEILRCLVRQGKALEINTSGLRKPYKETSPDLVVISRFRELGGRFVTLGSDAHNAADVGADLEAAAALAKEAGFTSVTWYQNRKPQQVML